MYLYNAIIFQRYCNKYEQFNKYFFALNYREKFTSKVAYRNEKLDPIKTICLH